MLAPSLTLLVEEGRLVLGRWQRILFVELDPPGERDLAIAILGTATAKLGRRRPRS